MQDYDSLKQELAHEDETFRHLVSEHQEYERRLDELNQKSLLSQDDELEEKRIKIHKLHLKDRMEAMLRSHSEERAAAAV